VDDAATARLMGSFYRRLWVQGLPAPVALRQAQVELLMGSIDGDGAAREPDFAARPPAGVAKPSPGAALDRTRLWAAFTISCCRDNARGGPEAP
jgi:CHAT domain-containing protein